MGCDIHSFAEIKRGHKWQKVTQPIFQSQSVEPFEGRNYSLFGFLANVRNYSECPVIGENRGLPLDSEYLSEPSDRPLPEKPNPTNREVALDVDYYTHHSHSWLSVKEMLEYDYSQTFENKRDAFDAEIKEIITLREHIGPGYFDTLEILNRLGEPEDVRVVYWFDN